MKVTIEEIRGKKYTVFWESPSKTLTIEEMQDDFMALPSGSLILYVKNDYYATALPALPRFPKPEHAKLLYTYMAEGLRIIGQSYDKWEVEFSHYDWELEFLESTNGNTIDEVTHCLLYGDYTRSNCIEVAIED